MMLQCWISVDQSVLRDIVSHWLVLPALWLAEQYKTGRHLDSTGFGVIMGSCDRWELPDATDSPFARP